MAREEILNGRAALQEVLERAGYTSTLAALAEHTVFLHPDTVGQTGGAPVFRVARVTNVSDRGKIEIASDGQPALLDDNTAPTDAFLWSADRRKGQDVQFNHIWPLSKDPRYYTALWNICTTPAFLAKLTDGDAAAKLILRRRSFDLYGYLPEGEAEPEAPGGYDQLRWPAPPSAVLDLESLLRGRLTRSPKSRTTKSARECGWLFSRFRPDNSI